jgi:2-(1,2-epoxy-1,2-dihydrophenyl)acetyl-CoA isomerase
MGGLCYLPLAVGLYRAKELLFSGRSIDAPEAYRLGMINRIFPKERLEEETLAFAQKIMEGMPLAIGLTKRILNTVFMDRLESVLEYEAQGQVLCSQTEEHRNRVAAVFRKTSSTLPGTERPKE